MCVCEGERDLHSCHQSPFVLSRLKFRGLTDNRGGEESYRGRQDTLASTPADRHLFSRHALDTSAKKIPQKKTSVFNSSLHLGALFHVRACVCVCVCVVQGSLK